MFSQTVDCQSENITTWFRNILLPLFFNYLCLRILIQCSDWLLIHRWLLIMLLISRNKCNTKCIPIYKLKHCNKTYQKLFYRIIPIKYKTSTHYFPMLISKRIYGIVFQWNHSGITFWTSWTTTLYLNLCLYSSSQIVITLTKCLSEVLKEFVIHNFKNQPVKYNTKQIQIYHIIIHAKYFVKSFMTSYIFLLLQQ